MLTRLLLALSFIQTPLVRRAPDVGVVPAGARIPIRFVDPIEGGRDSVGTLVRAQTMAPLAVGDCVLVPAFASVYGTVEQSVSGRLLGRRGALSLRFDVVETGVASWVSISAILDSLEWVGPDRLTDRGVLEGGHRSLIASAGATGGGALVAAATGVGALPVVAVAGFSVFRRGAPAQIQAGQEGALRLTAPLALARPTRCGRLLDVTDAPDATVLPPLGARTANKGGDVLGDPINVFLRGTRAQVKAAFAHAAWLPANPPSVLHLATGVGAALAAAPAARAPVSHQYYLGRVEDLAFQRASPSARRRHHVRLWQADSAGTLWAGAANEDIGLLVNPLKGRATHRIDPAIDHERDLLGRELMAGGCAGWEGSTSLRGAVRSGENVAGQAFVTDARALVLRLGKCAEQARSPS